MSSSSARHGGGGGDGGDGGGGASGVVSPTKTRVHFYQPRRAIRIYIFFVHFVSRRAAAAAFARARASMLFA
jgi:hypothetical protein